MRKLIFLPLLLLSLLCQSCLFGPVSMSMFSWTGEEDYDYEDEVVITGPEYIAVACPICGCCVPYEIECKYTFESFEDEIIIEEPELPDKDTRNDNHPDKPINHEKSNQYVTTLNIKPTCCLYKCETTGEQFFMKKQSNMVWYCDLY